MKRSDGTSIVGLAVIRERSGVAAVDDLLSLSDQAVLARYGLPDTRSPRGWTYRLDGTPSVILSFRRGAVAQVAIECGVE